MQTKQKLVFIPVFYFILCALLFYQKSYAASTFTVSAISDKHETISKKSVKVQKGKKATFTIKAKKGYIYSKLVAGNCPPGKWIKNKFTTGTITKSCKVYFSAGRVGSRIVAVTPSGDSNVTITPNMAEKIITGTLAQFKVTTTDSNYTVSATVTGTCPKGVWLDTIFYKLGPITKNCSVSFTSVATNGGGGNGGGGSGGYLPLKWVDASGNIYLPDSNNFILRMVDAGTQIINSIAGIPTVTGYTGDGGPATSAKFSAPVAVAKDSVGNLYISDTTNFVIRKIDTQGVITTVAGNNTQNYSGDNGPATLASINYALALALDSHDNLYISDRGSSTIRKVDVTTGIIKTIAGTPNVQGYAGDGGPATSAELGQIMGLVLDKNDNLYFADSTIRKISASSQLIFRIAGSSTQGGYSGDGGPATLALISGAEDVAVDDSGNIYISDLNNCAIRKINASNNIISTVAGIGGSCGYSGDGGPATAAQLGGLIPAIALDPAGNIYSSDVTAGTIRKIDKTTGNISTVVGTSGGGGCAYGGDGGPATAALFCSLFGH